MTQEASEASSTGSERSRLVRLVEFLKGKKMKEDSRYIVNNIAKQLTTDLATTLTVKAVQAIGGPLALIPLLPLKAKALYKKAKADLLAKMNALKLDKATDLFGKIRGNEHDAKPFAGDIGAWLGETDEQVQTFVEALTELENEADVLAQAVAPLALAIENGTVTEDDFRTYAPALKDIQHVYEQHAEQLSAVQAETAGPESSANHDKKTSTAAEAVRAETRASVTESALGGEAHPQPGAAEKSHEEPAKEEALLNTDNLFRIRNGIGMTVHAIERPSRATPEQGNMRTIIETVGNSLMVSLRKTFMERNPEGTTLNEEKFTEDNHALDAALRTAMPDLLEKAYASTGEALAKNCKEAGQVMQERWLKIARLDVADLSWLDALLSAEGRFATDVTGLIDALNNNHADYVELMKEKIAVVSMRAAHVVSVRMRKRLKECQDQNMAELDAALGLDKK